MRTLVIALAILATAGTGPVRAQAVPPVSAVDIPAPATALAPPRLVDTIELFRRSENANPSLEAAFVRRDGTLMVLLQESGSEDTPARLRRVEIGPDGKLVSARTLDRDLLRHYRATLAVPLVMRRDGTAAALETRDRLTHIVEIWPSGWIERFLVPSGSAGYLLAAGDDGYVAAFDRPAADGTASMKYWLAGIRRDGMGAWHAPAPPRQQIPVITATPEPGGGFRLVWSELDMRDRQGPKHRLGTAVARPGGLAKAQLSAGFAAEGAGIVPHAPLRFPASGPGPQTGAGPGGFFVGGWLFGSDGAFCAWFDAAGKVRLHNGSGPGGNPAAEYPNQAAAALADGSLIGMIEKSGDADPPTALVRAGPDGKILWRQPRPDANTLIRLVLFGGPDTLWLLGETRDAAGNPDRLFPERLTWR